MYVGAAWHAAVVSGVPPGSAASALPWPNERESFVVEHAIVINSVSEVRLTRNGPQENITE